MKSIALMLAVFMFVAGCTETATAPVEKPDKPAEKQAEKGGAPTDKPAETPPEPEPEPEKAPGTKLEIVEPTETVVKGSPFAIIVKSTGSPHPSQVSVFVQIEEEKWLQFPAVRVSETEFRMRMHSVQASFTYYAAAGSVETPHYKVEVK